MSSMIADLVGALNNLKDIHEDHHIQERALPCSRFKINRLLAQRTRQRVVKHTFTVDPQERPPRIPFF